MNLVPFQGSVLVDDRRNRSTQMAQAGLVLDGNGDYVIATTPTSRAEVVIQGKPILLPESCFLRIRRDRSWQGAHGQGWTGDAKRFLGRIWSQVARDDHKQDEVNVVVGVRG